MRRFSVPHSALLTAISLLLLTLLTSCNRREDLLLPPNLDPKEYVISNRILVYADHLIRSENDDSYLYLPKESISDSLIWYGDTIYFNKVESLLQRDNLVLATGSSQLSSSYRVMVRRNDDWVSFDNAADFATIYTDLSHAINLGRADLVSYEYLLDAQGVDIYPYGKKRAFFNIDATGDFALAKLAGSNELRIGHSESSIQGLLKDADATLRMFFPVGYSAEMGETVVQLKNEFGPSQLQIVQGVFPGFAMLSKVLQITTQNAGTSSNPPIIHYTSRARKSFDTKWLKLQEQRIDTWESAEDTWVFEGDTLISFVNGSGNYALLQPLSGQDNLRLSLDGSYRQIYLQDMWLDLKDLNEPGIELQISANPPIPDIMQDYFTNKPYNYNGKLESYEVLFLDGEQILQSLPDDGWLEFGFYTESSNPSNNRLMRVYRDGSRDIFSYKSFADAYDASHFSVNDSFVYSGISASGRYLFADIYENNSVNRVPCLKDELYLQMERTTVSYLDANPPCNAVVLEYNQGGHGAHPWISGQPYTLTGAETIMKISTTGGRADALPQNLFLQTAVSGNPQSVINHSVQADYPKFIRYNKSDSLQHNTFLHAGGILSISPAYAGYLIDAEELAAIGDTRDLAMFPKMIFDDFDIEVYLNSANAMPQSTLRIARSTALNDPYQVLQDQYDLSYLSPAYSFDMLNNASFYQSFSPYIRIKHQSRSQDLLISVSNEEHYRVYSYPEGDAADGWHFLNSDGHYAFSLPYDAQYAIVKDMNPHDAAQISLSAGQDGHLSLYQAQVYMPEEQIGSSIAAGSIVKLEHLDSIPGGTDSRSAYRLGITDPQQNTLQPDFFEQTIEAWPYLYLPVPDFAPGQPLRVFYRDSSGNTQELSQVDSFSDFPDSEFIVIGNCAVVFINNPGLFYTQ